MNLLGQGLALAGALLAGMAFCDDALAQKPGGTLKVYFFDSPGSMSIHEESTIAGEGPAMGVFNNLVMYKQDVSQSGLNSIGPDLATEWAWDEENKSLSFKLHEGVKWHDGKPFTAKDVKCTFDALMGGEEKSEIIRKNPRKIWYVNLKDVAANGDSEVTFTLGRPQPSFLSILAAGYSPVYSCHVPDRVRRSKPIGTGPFKVVDFKRNESIKLVKNPDYWKKGKPYVDAIEWKIVPNRSTRLLGFQSGEFDMTFDSDVTFPLLKDVKSSKADA